MAQSIAIKVRGYHLDLFSHVNNARYLEFLEEARWNYFENDTPFTNFITENILSFPIVNININYRNPAGFNDTLKIVTKMKRIGRKSATLDQKIYIINRDCLSVDAEVTFVILDNKSGHAVELPEEIRTAWQKNIIE